MASNSPLTATEWANWHHARAAGDQAALEDMLLLLARGGRWEAVAALALHRQPFGFAHHDLSALRHAMVLVRKTDATGLEGALWEIADRITKLLPPEGTRG